MTIIIFTTMITMSASTMMITITLVITLVITGRYQKGESPATDSDS